MLSKLKKGDKVKWCIGPAQNETVAVVERRLRKGSPVPQVKNLKTMKPVGTTIHHDSIIAKLDDETRRLIPVFRIQKA